LVFDFVVVTHGRHVSASLTPHGRPLGDISLYSWLNVASALLAAALLWIGIVNLRGSRLDGYIWIERSLLVSICLTQVFVFVQSQFSAVFILAIEIVLLVTVRAMIRAERKLEAQQRVGRAPPPAPRSEPAAEPAHEVPAPS
jgi:hypothetical protein